MTSHETYDAARALSPIQQRGIIVAMCQPRDDKKVEAFWRAVANDVAAARDDAQAAFNALIDDALGSGRPES